MATFTEVPRDSLSPAITPGVRSGRLGARSVQAAIRSLLEGMHHGAATSGAGFSREEFLNGYRTATAIFAFPGAQGNNVVTASEALAALGQRSWRPHVNIIFAGACSTAGSQATMPPPVLGANGAYGEFARLAWILGIQDASAAFGTALKHGRQVSNGRDYAVAGAARNAQKAYGLRHRANELLSGNANVPRAVLTVKGHRRQRWLSATSPHSLASGGCAGSRSKASPQRGPRPRTAPRMHW